MIEQGLARTSILLPSSVPAKLEIPKHLTLGMA